MPYLQDMSTNSVGIIAHAVILKVVCKFHELDHKLRPDVGIYKRKQEIKKENALSTKKIIKIFFIFSWSLSGSRACFLSFFLDHYRFLFFSWSLSGSRACFLSFFYFSWSFSWSKACFLVFLLSCVLFINSHLRLVSPFYCSSVTTVSLLSDHCSSEHLLFLLFCTISEFHLRCIFIILGVH